METILIILLVFAFVVLAIVVELLVLDMTHKNDEQEENDSLSHAPMFSSDKWS